MKCVLQQSESVGPVWVTILDILVCPTFVITALKLLMVFYINAIIIRVGVRNQKKIQISWAGLIILSFLTVVVALTAPAL